MTILGTTFATPPAALDPDFVTQQIMLNGAQMSSDVSEAVSDAQLDRTIQGASTFTLVCEDVFRTLLRSTVFQSAVTVQYDGLSFTLVEIQKSSDQLNLTFEDTVVNRLRNTTGQYASSALTRAAFIKQIISQTPGIVSTVYDSGEQLTTPLARGTSSDPTEDSWTCLQRVANQVQWRCFSDGEQIFVGPDSWLLSQPSLGTIAENSNGVDFIDFDFDVGKPLTTATVNCIAGLWQVPPGRPVGFAGMGVADGLWLVEDISRSIFLQDAVITCTQPVVALTEASLSAATTGGTDGTTATGTGADSTAVSVVAFAVAAIGTPYVYGGESPSGYDCSGLAQAAYKSAGISIPRTSEAQFAAGPKVQPPYQAGDLIFFEENESGPGPGHVGIYVGNGQMIDAPHTGTKVRQEAVFSPVVGATRPR